MRWPRLLPLSLICLLIALISVMSLAQPGPAPIANQPNGLPIQVPHPGTTRSSAQQTPLPQSPAFKSPVMRQMWENLGKNHHDTKAKPQAASYLNSPFLITPPMYPLLPGSNPLGVAIGDFNSDGKRDVVVAANPPQLLLGNGDGTFQAAVAIATIAASDVAVADFNHDGKLDVAFAITGGVVVYLGNGDGTFSAGSTYSSGGTNQYGILVADVNNDGFPDLIVNTDTGISVLLGNGLGTFEPAKASSVPFGVTSMATADFNKDGRLDLAVTDGYSTLNILLGKGDGTFSSFSSYPLSEGGGDIATADFNQDGNQDVALSGGQIFLGNGDGTLSGPSSFETNYSGSVFAAVDMNGDGIPDLLTASGGGFCGYSWSFGTTGISFGNGDGTFQPILTFVSGGCYGHVGVSMTTGDLNGDGFPDVVEGIFDEFNGLSLSILLNRRNGTFPAAELDVSSGSGSVAVGDFNQDGNLDLAQADGTIHLGDGTGMLRFFGSANLGGVQLATADFNKDGKPDLAAAVECVPEGCASGGALAIAMGNGDGSFQPATSLPTAGFYAESLVAADFNSDGNQDIAIVNNCVDVDCSTKGGSLSIFLGNGDGTFSAGSTFVLTSGHPLTIVVGDFNNDGVVDLAVMSCNGFCPHSGTVDILFGNGDGTFQSPIVDPNMGGPAAVAGDFNQDGILDLAIVSGIPCGDCGGYANIMYGNGDGSFSAGPQIWGGGDGTISIVAADFFGTGMLTPVLASVCPHCYPSTLSMPGAQIEDISFRYLGVGDFNNDGKPDLAGSLEFGGAGVLLNVDETLMATTTTISPSVPQSTHASQSVTFTAQIVHTGPGMTTGMVNFLDSGVYIGSASVDFNGQALFTTDQLAMGSHFVVAYYQGDTNLAPSNSLGVHVTVNKATTNTTLLSSINPSAFGKPVTFTALVSSLAGTPTGKIEYLNGTTVLATVKLTAGSARYTTSKLPRGFNSITAVYEGDSKNSGSTSLPVNQIVLEVTTTTLSSSRNPSTYGQAVTFKAVVTSSVGAPPNGETISFMNGTTVLGTGTLKSGLARLTTSTLAAGNNSITAVYSGDPNFGGSTSKAVTQVVETQAPYGVVSPTTLNLGQVVVGETSPAKLVTLKNTGKSQLTVSNIAISQDFAITANSCAKGVKPLTHCNVSVTFTPQGTGTATGSLTFTDNASNSPQTISLTGTGTN
jgi:Bacterial Ig-like domain (group 3)/FG-GAP-like repeat/Abnormal spindle-like microcephaly-assoc'd, ASPM-SPD-2-Hydin